MHPHTELRPVDGTVGLGVYATKLIPRGTLVWVKDDLDQVIRPSAFRLLDPLRRRVVEKYAWQEADGSHILCWDHARFVNHSCEANCLGVGVDFEVAVRDIPAGQQLTDDYRTLGRFAETFPCKCGTPSCMGVVKEGATPEMQANWKRLFGEALQLSDQVEQLLAPYVSRFVAPQAQSAPAAAPVMGRIRL